MTRTAGLLMDRHEKRTEQDFGPGVRGEEPSDDLVILLDAQPVGLLQRSQISDYPEEVERFSTLVDIPPGASSLTI
jgi:aminoglycoside 6'-N-acetyltransferase